MIVETLFSLDVVWNFRPTQLSKLGVYKSLLHPDDYGVFVIVSGFCVTATEPQV